MFYWILAALCNSLSDITYKKALNLWNGKVSDKLFQFLAVLQWIILMTWLGVLFLSDSHLVEISANVFNISVVWLLALSAIIWIWAEFLFQYAFKNEKVSVLTPYGQLEWIFTVILGFIFLSWNNKISLIFALIAWAILIFSSVNLNKLTLNTYCVAMIIASLLSAFQYVIYWMVLLQISPESLLIFETWLNVIFLFIIIFLSKELRNIKKINSQFTIMLWCNTITWYISVFIWMYLISEFWLIQAVLIWMLWLVSNLLFSYLFLWETISKKDILVTSLVWICVAGGTLLW